MGKIVNMDLDDTPWPASILKYNEKLGELASGDRLVATIQDADAVHTLRIILSHTPGLIFRIQKGGTAFRIEASKK